MGNELLQDGVLRNLHTLSESSQRISARSQALCPGVDWRNLSGFRDVLVHDYLGIDLARVWSIVMTDIPALKNEIIRLTMDLGN